MDESRKRRGLSLSKNMKNTSNRTLTNSSFSQTRSFIDKVLPDLDQKPLESNCLRNSERQESFCLQRRNRRGARSYSNLEETQNSTILTSNFKYFENSAWNPKVYTNLKNQSLENSQIPNVNIQLRKLMDQLYKSTRQRENIDLNMEQIRESHQKKMSALVEKKENLKANIKCLRDAKVISKSNNLTKKSNVCQIQELNMRIGELLKDIESTFQS